MLCVLTKVWLILRVIYYKVIMGVTAFRVLWPVFLVWITNPYLGTELSGLICRGAECSELFRKSQFLWKSGYLIMCLNTDLGVQAYSSFVRWLAIINLLVLWLQMHDFRAQVKYCTVFFFHHVWSVSFVLRRAKSTSRAVTSEGCWL